MPERGFATGFWTDPFIVKLPFEAKGLYIYLWTNDHCNQAGLYEVALETIASETKLAEDRLPELFTLLTLKIKWSPEQNLVWVKNFIKRQSKSPKFLIAVAKSLSTIHNNGAISELLEYNRIKYSILIPYPYYMDTVAIPSASDLICTSTSTKGKGGMGEGDRVTFSTSFDTYKEKLRVKYPALDINNEWERCQIWFRDHNKRIKSPSLALGNWCKKEMEIRAEKEKGEQGEQQPKPQHPRRRPVMYIRGSGPVGSEGTEDMPQLR